MESEELKVVERRLRQRFVRAFATYDMLSDGDRVLVGLSGGSDSLCLLELLVWRSRIQHPHFEVEAVHVRMSNIAYSTSTDYLQHFCDELGVRLHVIETSFEVGGDVADLRRQKQPCFLCSWNRRKQMFNLAQQLHCNKLALGHHQDDMLHTCLMNLFFQGRFDTMPARLTMKKMPLTIIRPLCLEEETDIKHYAELRGYEPQQKRCPYEHDSHRTAIRQLYEQAEHLNPEVRFSIWNALKRDARLFLSVIMVLFTALSVSAQGAWQVAGSVTDADTGQPVEFASVLLTESGLWAVTDAKGSFHIKNVPTSKNTLTVQCLGYEKRVLPMNITHDVTNLKLRLKPDNLKLNEVTVVARRKQDEATTSYTIDRTTLDNQQLLNIADIGTLLPGGKTVNPSLMDDARLSLRSSSQEKGNTSFGTAVEVDGQRMDNNAMPGETTGASTRTISSSNIESVEIVTGIPSVEYGDLSNGVVKVNTRRGKSPFIVEGRLNQHTRQVAVNKGFSLGQTDSGASYGVLNASLEHARSFSDAASPHTAYQRNVFSLHYMNTLLQQSTPLTLNIGLTGNVGGYNSEADPDNELDDYAKARDNALRGSLDLQWLLNKPWITNMQLSASYSFSDRRQETYSHTSSASTQPYLHATEEGYYMAGANGNDIILGPTGYWYVLGYHDSKPTSWAAKLKADWTRRFGNVTNRLTAGTQYNGSKNQGRGTYYDDMSLAPTWREYRYDRLPPMHNLAFYVEEKISVPMPSLITHPSSSIHNPQSTLEVTAGLRDDITLITGSDYGTVSSLSPRLNSRYIFWRNQRKQWVSDLELHAGWGKSVKLPSFQVLYPQPTYSDLLAFSSTSTSNNTSYYAYHTYPTRALYNPGLRWQYTYQTDLGLTFNIKGTRVSVSAFRHATHRSYVSTRQYTPFAYLYTPPSALNGINIPADDRRYTIDHETGVVSVCPVQDPSSITALNGTERHTYTTQSTYTNAPASITRQGVEWIVDFAQIKALHTQLRIDGNFYQYKGLDDLLFADIPLGVANVMSNGQPYQYVGYYRGSSVTSAGTVASASVSNGALQRETNLNVTLTTHLPRLRLIVALRGELSLQNYRKPLSEFSDGSLRGIVPEGSDYFGQPYDGTSRDNTIILYPEYYTTWDNPTEMIPFAEKFLWAKDNDAALYSDLSKLVVRSNYSYTMNPNRLSRYYSANLSVTKEIGDHVSVSFYANNLWNNMRRIRSSQTDTETSLFGSGYIPSYYYGLSLRLKI